MNELLNHSCQTLQNLGACSLIFYAFLIMNAFRIINWFVEFNDSIVIISSNIMISV